MLGLLLSIVTYTIASRTTVTTMGIEPVGSSVSYSCTATTGSKEQLTEGNAMSFSLQGWQSQKIERVSLQMKSNKTEGAGSLLLTIDSSAVWEIKQKTFSNSAWNGKYTTDYVSIEKTFAPAKVCVNGEMSLTVSASHNSLYVSSLTIEYTPQTDVAYTVSFMTQTGEEVQPLTEPSAGEGVALPSCTWEDDDWKFVGWTTEALAETTTKPTYKCAGELFYPRYNQTLYAVYQKGETETGRWQTTTLVSGKYAMGIRFGVLAYGGVTANTLLGAEADITQPKGESGLWFCEGSFPAEVAYAISMRTDSTATIEHVQTGKYLWHNGQNKLVEGNGEWKVKVLADYTVLFYYMDGANTYALHVDAVSLDEFCFKIVKIDMTKSVSDGLLLFPVRKLAVAQYSSFPLGQYQAIETVSALKETYYIVPFGLYEIHIHNGVKTLYLKQ